MLPISVYQPFERRGDTNLPFGLRSPKCTLASRGARGICTLESHISTERKGGTMSWISEYLGGVCWCLQRLVGYALPERSGTELEGKKAWEVKPESQGGRFVF